MDTERVRRQKPDTNKFIVDTRTSVDTDLFSDSYVPYDCSEFILNSLRATAPDPTSKLVQAPLRWPLARTVKDRLHQQRISRETTGST